MTGKQCPTLNFELMDNVLYFIQDGVQVVVYPGIPKSPKYEGKYRGVNMTAEQILENAVEIQRRSNSYKAYVWLKSNFDIKYL